MLKAPSLVSYSGSSSEEEFEQITPRKRKPSSNNEKISNEKKKICLPVPEGIKQLYEDKQKHVDDPDQHEGRQRSFPHEEGNWATLVSIPYEPDERFTELQESLFKCLRPQEFQPMADYHISLSRTVTIRHHWIPSLTESLRKSFRNMNSCACEIFRVKLFTNDEKTRSFLGLEVRSGGEDLERFVQLVDTCLQEYRLPVYYKPPVFHISCGWCLGDISQQVTKETKDKLQVLLSDFLREEPTMKYIGVDSIHCKTGNKLFSFPLADT